MLEFSWLMGKEEFTEIFGLGFISANIFVFFNVTNFQRMLQHSHKHAAAYILREKMNTLNFIACRGFHDACRGIIISGPLLNFN